MKTLTVERVAVIAGFLALAAWFVLFLRDTGLNHDVYHQMALARESLALGYVPNHDLYSYAPTRSPVVDHEWLAGLAALAAYTAGGAVGFGVLWLAIAAGCAACCARALFRLPPLAAFAAGFVSFPLVTYSLFQPLIAQSWSVLLCGVLLFFLQADAAGRHRLVFWTVPLFVLWANLHGGVVIGLGIVAACAVERRLRGEPWRHLAALLLILLAALSVNPYGWRYYQYLARALTMPRPQIGEWQPAWLFGADYAYSVPFALMAAAYLVAAAKAGLRFRGALVTALVMLASVRAHKVLPFFALAWLFYVPAALSAVWPGGLERLWKKLLPFAGPAFATATILLCMLVRWNLPWPVRVPDEPRMGRLIQPVHAVDYLQRTGFRGNIMTFFRHGAYVSWRLYPRVKVSCDARYELAYPDGYAERNLAMYQSAPQMLREELRRLPATDLILTDRRSPLDAELSRIPGWALAYSDTAFAIYAPRADASSRAANPLSSKPPGS
jgi:hypothetical protein